MPTPFDLPFFQRGVIEILLLALASGLLGTWVVLRGLSFLAHAVGTSSFPGLVLAQGLGFAPVLGALASALVVAALVAVTANARGASRDSVTALALAASLAAGAILASDVFDSQGSIDRLLFGSLLAIDRGDQVLAGVAALGAAAGTWLLGPRWLASGFSGAAHGSAGRVADAALIALVALAAIAALSAVGALLATTVIVLPAATTRLLTDRLRPWQVATVVLAALEGVGGLWLSVELNSPPGAAIAVLSGAVLALTATARGLVLRRRLAAPLAGGLGMVAVLALAGCGSDDPRGAGRLSVAATTSQVADIARNLGGDQVDVRQVLPAGADPHAYEPRPADVKTIARADVILVSGLGVDSWAGDLIEAAGTKATAVDLGAGVLHPLVTGDGDEDPHWWHDPRNVIASTDRIERAFVEAGAQAPAIRAAASAYRARVRALDRGAARCISRIPASQRKIVTDHDALGYFTRRYGVRVVGAVFQAQSAHAQASAGEVAALERTIRSERVRAIFPDQALNARLAEQIARDTGATAGYKLYGDALGERGSGAEDYIAMVAANADALVRGMSGGRLRCRISP